MTLIKLQSTACMHLMADGLEGLLDVHDVGRPHGVQHQRQRSLLQLLPLARQLQLSLRTRLLLLAPAPLPVLRLQTTALSAIGCSDNALFWALLNCPMLPTHACSGPQMPAHPWSDMVLRITAGG